MKFVMSGLIVLVLGLGAGLFTLNNQIGELEADNEQQVAEIERLEHDINEVEYCHELANSLAFDAEYLVVDLYDYGDNFSFWVSLDLWLEKADVYNAACVEGSGLPILGT